MKPPQSFFTTLVKTLTIREAKGVNALAEKTSRRLNQARGDGFPSHNPTFPDFHWQNVQNDSDGLRGMIHTPSPSPHAQNFSISDFWVWGVSEQTLEDQRIRTNGREVADQLDVVVIQQVLDVETHAHG
jgi:hypothetical protein